jgi:DHA1 family bicyclomycin/chloramphenicol resistance-like MFS transporter
VLAGASALALSRARFAAGAGAALMGSAQYAVAAAAAPVGGILGSHTAVPMAAGMLACLVVSALCAARTRP